MRTLRRRMIRQSSLPTSYERLGYIENTSTAYIDCGIILNKDDVAALQLKISDIKSIDQWMGANAYLQIKSSPNSVSNGSESLYISNMDVVNAYYKDMKYYLSVNNKTIVREWKNANYISPLCLFRLVINNIEYSYTLCKIHFAKVYIKDSLTMHFIPVKRKSDGVIGMYDLVGRKFYTSPNGEAFTGG